MSDWTPHQAPPPDDGGFFFQGQPGFPPPNVPQQPGQGQAAAGTGDEGFFKPASGPGQRQAPPAPQQVSVPPPYEGPISQPQDPFAQFPAVPLSPGAQPAPAAPPKGSPPPEGLEAPERIPYQAPPKQRSVIVYLYIGLAALVLVLGAMGITQLLNRTEPRTAIVTISERGSTYAGNAIIVRDESVFSQEGVANVVYTAEENGAVTRGDPVCTVYTTGFSSKEMTQLTTYRRQIKDYLQILRSQSDAPDTKLQLLENTIYDRAVETRALVQGAHGNLINQERLLKDAMNSRYSYLRQKYPDDSKLTRLYDNESNQLQRIEVWTKQYAATDNGLVSFYTDGFESALNMDNYDQFTPQQVKSMYQGKVPEAAEQLKDSMDIYRLVRPYSWAVLMLAENLSWNPVVGETYQLMIESFDNTTVEAVVESVTRSGGDLLVRLRVDSPVDPVLNIRSCHVQLSTSIITYAVPNSAIVNKEGVIGLVVSFKEGQFIVPIVIVSQDATQSYVVPVNPGYLWEGLSVQLFN